jgi:hypothetical protein
MSRSALPIFSAGLLLISICAHGATSFCDLNQDGVVNAADVQAAINMSLGLATCTANIAGANVCNIVVVQRVIVASLGGTCLTSTGLHVVELSWTASTGAVGYNVYRATTSGGPYTVFASPGNVISYMDSTVVSGQTYYYVVTSLNSSNVESAYSTQTQAVIPTP